MMELTNINVNDNWLKKLFCSDYYFFFLDSVFPSSDPQQQQNDIQNTLSKLYSNKNKKGNDLHEHLMMQFV